MNSNRSAVSTPASASKSRGAIPDIADLGPPIPAVLDQPASNMRLERRLGDRTHAATLLHGLNVQPILERRFPRHAQRRAGMLPVVRRLPRAVFMRSGSACGACPAGTAILGTRTRAGRPG